MNTMFPSQQLPSEPEIKYTTLYKVIADHQYNAESYQKIADKGTKYDSLQAAYDAYVEKITEDSNYSQFKDTLSKN